MKAQISLHSGIRPVDLSRPIRISVPLSRQGNNPHAYFLPPALIVPISADGFIGDVRAGGSCNCEQLTIAPHGNGTHTECVGHISAERVFIKDSLTAFLFHARVVSCTPEHDAGSGDRIISMNAIRQVLEGFTGDALVVRTLPNDPDKGQRRWSGTNPPYFEPGVGTILVEHGIRHLLCDLPSVDRESDGGLMSVHHEFWQYPERPRTDATITEMIFVPESVADGEYLVQISVPPIESDAAPSDINLYVFLDSPQLMP
ncbi:MAG: cyclase family protein [Candidatus Kapaibacterium sp.]